ncbi:mannose-6-phosphate isomerase type 1 [Microbacterium sp. AG790]|uniref:mannose-6-phosphate isomerase, class I n=1 Tax=Microbacterium sp. AG790 TaxID=2183995 RepID=UPI000EB57E11|nr:mannose-6-phosphate isomerase, class I [Microbacterium sp. AG790]RKS88578.1 mannose-6-phosphate isomerase type 1 [Microbacterium sp. AG790]
MLTPISNDPRDYSWGSTTLIPALEGRESTGAPEAEIWYGDHPGCPSRTSDGRTLDVALAEAGRPALPFLLKLLAAASSLSIQAHPTRAQAQEGFAREERAGIPRDAADRLYRDDNHKPEIIVALSDEFRALVGLRPLAATRRFLSVLAAAGDEVPAGVAQLQRRLDVDDDGPAAERALRDVLAWALGEADAATVQSVATALDAAATAERPEFADEIAVLRAAASDFPGDGGLIVALLMNLVTLRRSEGLFAPAGVLHAYQSGLGVELMAASDNVMRGGLTPKHVDVPELLHVLDAAPAPAPVIRPRPLADGVDVYDTPVDDFLLERVTVAGDTVRVAVHGPAIALCTDGEVVVGAASGAAALRPGAAVHIADEDAVEVSGTGELFLAQPGS